MSLFHRRDGKLSLLTWNVWFGLEKPHRRWTELLSIVGAARPDVIAFQEVTDPFLSMLRATPWVKKAYTLSDPRGETIEQYGTVIATRMAQGRVDVHPLESGMGRKLVVVEADVGGLAWAFASVHLESLKPSATVRGRQLEKIFEILSPLENVVLMGDLNFCSSWEEENSRIPADYIDLWPTVRAEEGFTVDWDLNPIRSREVGAWKRVRYDRILFRSAHVRPVKAELTGTEVIKGEVPDLVPSDHFGVLGHFHIV
jgi:endonuclease/exonuclease/phosphatase family metal-dependent hydrolase